MSIAEDAGPPTATGFTAVAEPRGVILKWQTAAHALAVPAYAYTVERASGGVHESLTLHPQLLTMDKGTANPFIDHAPPVETDVTYQLRLVDVLGVPSAPATVQVNSPDFAAGAPPTGQSAKAARGVVELTWTAFANSRASGLMIERSQLPDGPYEWLTPKGLSPQTTRFEDHNVFPGASYYYRVRAVTPGGALGAPGDPLHAQALARRGARGASGTRGAGGNEPGGDHLEGGGGHRSRRLHRRAPCGRQRPALGAAQYPAAPGHALPRHHRRHERRQLRVSRHGGRDR